MLNELVHPDIRFTQPLHPPVRGHAEAAEFWRHIFAIIPDLTGRVLNWAFSDGVLFIEQEMRGTLGGHPIEWITIDRISLANGRARDRVAHFDPTPLVRAIAVRPSALAAWTTATLRHRYTSRR